MAKLEKLISLYDCIAWVPSIRGSLSLDLVDNANNILGDVDKYSVKFKKLTGFILNIISLRVRFLLLMIVK